MTQPTGPTRLTALTALTARAAGSTASPGVAGGGAARAAGSSAAGSPAAGSPAAGSSAAWSRSAPPSTVSAPSSAPQESASARESASALPPYGLAARISDWWQARADGRAALPGLEPGRPAGTPTLEEHAQDFLASSLRERLQLDLEITPMLETRAALVARIPETERALRRTEAQLAAMPTMLDDDQRTLRRAGETDTPDDVVAARRAREYEAMRRPLADEVTRLQDQIGQMRVEHARLGSTVRARELVGATRVRRLHAQIMRRISAYERHLVRRHPAGDRIGTVLAAQHPVLPPWVLAAERVDEPPLPAPGPASSPGPHRGTEDPPAGPRPGARPPRRAEES